MFRILTCALAIAALAAAGAAGAASKPIKLSEGLRGLSWGASLNAVRANLKRLIRKRYGKAIKAAVDVLAQRKVRDRMAREFRDLIAGYRRFDGKRTGLEVGIAGGEFRHGSGESALVVREPKADWYYFFIGLKLWKVYIVYANDSIKGLTFPRFVAGLTARYGPPSELVKEKRGKRRIVTAARWRSDSTYLEARDRSQFFRSYTLTFADREVRQRLADLRAKPVTRQPDATDALIEMATGRSAPPLPPGMAPANKRKKKQPPKVVDIY